MMTNYLNYLPKFKSVEINQSTGYRVGHLISQAPATVADLPIKEVSGNKFLENGVILGLSNNGNLEKFDLTKHSAPVLEFDEPLFTIDSAEADNSYAMDVTGMDTCYPAGVVLYLNDTITTDNFSGVADSAAFAKVVDGIVTAQTAADADTIFIAKKVSMPNETGTGLELIYIGRPMKVTA